MQTVDSHPNGHERRKKLNVSALAPASSYVL
jgi:hypothetical protein